MLDSIEAQADVAEIVERLRAALDNNPAVVFAYLFGSLPRGTAGPTSDIDIAVYLKAGTDFAEVKLGLAEKLVDALGTDRLDVVTLNTAPLPLNTVDLGRYRHSGESRNPDFMRFSGPRLSPG